MRLHAYLRIEQGRLTQLAKDLAIPTSTLQGYAVGRRRLNVATAAAIERATHGAVTMQEMADSFPLAPAEAEVEP